MAQLLKDLLAYSTDDILWDAEPYDHAVKKGVYFLIYNGIIEYVGQSKNLYGRFSNHEHIKPHHAIAFIRVDNPVQRDKVEAFYINKYQPRLNIRGTKRESEMLKAAAYTRRKHWVKKKNDMPPSVELNRRAMIARDAKWLEGVCNDVYNEVMGKQ
jgi:hypothetical protein